MKISGFQGLKTIKGATLHANEFVRGCRNMRAIPYQPADRLLQAFERYGFIEFMVDKAARPALENDALISRFLANQKKGMTLAENIEATFADQTMIALIHEDGPVCFMATRPNLEIARDTELIELRDDLIGRDSRWPKVLPDLDAQEGGSLLSGQGRQDLHVQILERQIPFRGRGR
ncbi:hypothetical protein ACFL37_01085 [Candidatus Margulisiibacteriota bacterium]